MNPLISEVNSYPFDRLRKLLSKSSPKKYKNDLINLSIGEPKQNSNKEILKILEAAKKRNLLAGIHNGSAEYAQKMIQKGFNLVTVGSDQRFMSSGAKTSIEKLKGVKKGPDVKGY